MPRCSSRSSSVTRSSALRSATRTAGLHGRRDRPTQGSTLDAKYKDESSRLYIPAHITEEQIATVRQDAVRVYTALGCRGLSRVDFFVTHDSGEVVFNELNAIPGFTSISMYPKLFDYEGIGYAELLDRLISLALEEHNG
ncbi:MAG: hypothetical protein ACLRIO_03975 [Butyricicoccus sp.]